MKRLLAALLCAGLLVGCAASPGVDDSQNSETANTQEIISSVVVESVEPESEVKTLIDVYNEFKINMEEIIKETESSDEMTVIMKIWFEDSFNGVNSFNNFTETMQNEEVFGKFVQTITYFEMNYEEGSVGNEIGVMGWEAIYSLMMDDGKFKDKMSDLKEYYEANISPIYETKYESGQYKAGIDIPSGEYIIFADSGSGYFAVTADNNGDDIIANENFDYNSIITVNDGEYLELSRCKAVPISEVDNLPVDKANMFKIGTHLSAGEYKLVADSDSAYYCVYNDGRHEDIEANNNFSGQSYVTVLDGQYLLLSRCHIEQ